MKYASLADAMAALKIREQPRRKATYYLNRANNSHNRASYQRQLENAQEWLEIALSKGRSEQALAAKNAIAHWTRKLHSITA